MKKYLGLALLASVATTSAFASIARLEALGEDQYGSQYIDDNRNVFLNAATANDHGSYATYEWGDTTKFKNSEVPGTNSTDGPKAQGGVFKNNGDATFGIYFGNDSNTASDLRAGGISALVQGGANANLANLAGQVQNENTLDLVYAKDAGSMKWGVRLSHAQANNEQGYTYATGKTAAKISKKGTLLGLGAIQGDNEVYANIGLQNEFKAETITDLGGGDFHFKGKIGYQLGYIRALGNGARAFVEYQNQKMEEKEQSSLSEDWEVTKIKVGYGKTSKVNDKFTAFYKAIYASEDHKKYVFTSNKQSEQYLKATLGFEVMAKEWLTFRGSIANNLFGEAKNTNNKKKTIADAVDVKMGATLAFGDFAIDGLVGNDTNGDGTNGDENGTLRTDSLMSRVSMTYKF